MNIDTRTARYKLIYGAVMLSMLFVLVTGSVWFARSPHFSMLYAESALRGIAYTVEFYLQEGGSLRSLFFGSRETVFADNSSAVSVPILVYHGVIDGSIEEESYDVTLEEFKEHMFALKRAGYVSVTTEDLEAFIRGERELPSRPIVITFDDGRTDSFYNGDSVLNAVDYKAVMYVIGMFAGPNSEYRGRYYLSDREIAMLSQSDRWEIGSHSFNGHRSIAQNEDGSIETYFYGGRMWLPEERRLETMEEFRARVTEDMRESQRVLQEITGEPVLSLSFPFGDYAQREGADAQMEEIVLSEASKYYDLMFYQSAPHQHFSQAYAAIDPESAEQVLVRRIRIANGIDSAELLKMISYGTAKALPYTALLNGSDGWVNAWGGQYLLNGTLVLDGQGRSPGAATILDGTRHWTDYRVDAEVTTNDNTNVILMIRHDNEGDTTACNYGTDFVHINQRLDGDERVIRGVDGISVFGNNETITVAAEVEGRSMRCYLNGELIVETQFLDPTLAKGGTGLRAWNRRENARIVIHSFSVSPLRTETASN